MEHEDRAGKRKTTGRQGYTAAAFVVLVALAAAELLRPLGMVENLNLIFLTAVVAIAAKYGLGPSLAASIASVLTFNFFFVPPVFTFEVADAKHLAGLVLFAAVAVLVSKLAARARALAHAAAERALALETLYAFSRTIAAAVTRDELARTAAEGMSELLARNVILLLPDIPAGELVVASTTNPNEDVIEDIELDAARASWGADEWQERRVMRIGAHLFYPLRAASGAEGLVALSRDSGPAPLNPAEERLFDTLADQVSSALVRLRLGRERDEARVAAEGERLRTALLSSLSHDLKTPLASIMGAVTALRSGPDLYDVTARDELTAMIQDETERMTRFVANLLDMSRIEAGGISLSREAVDIGDVVGTALQRTAKALSEHDVIIDLKPDLPMLHLDVVLFEQVLVNLLDNASKYAASGTRLTVKGQLAGPNIEIDLIDEGPGLPVGSEDRVFDKFYRANNGDRQLAGTGLGLAICQGFMEALGGRILAANRNDRAGAVFTLSFPVNLIATPSGRVVQ